MPPKKKGTGEALARLKRDLKEHTVGQLYIFYGPEDYLREHYLERLQQETAAGPMEAFNLHTFQGKELDIRGLEQAVEAVPVMSERSLVLVYDFDLFQNKDRQSQMLELLGDLPDYVCLVFVYDLISWSSNGTTKLGKLLKEKAQVVEFAQQSQSDLNSWIRRRLRRDWDKEIDNATAEYLTFLCGGLMTNLAGELDKLGAYAKGSEVTRADIDAVADPVLDARAFQMTDAIGLGDYDRAMTLLSELGRMGESPIYILAAVGRQLRQIWSARLALEARRGESYLADLWGMRNGWQARKLLQTARRYELPWCRQAVRLVQEADLAMKLGGRDGEEVLTELLLTLAQSARQRSGVRR